MRSNGLDVSVPIFGYPFGVRIGAVKVNSNMVRGNTAYTVHNNIGAEVLPGVVERTSVIEFAANSQINEGNIRKILEDPKIDKEVKIEFIKYLNNQKSPEVLPVTAKTAHTATVSSKNEKSHNVTVEAKKTLTEKVTKSYFDSLNEKLISKISDKLKNNEKVKIFCNICKILALSILILFIFDLFRKLIKFIVSPFKKKKKV